MIGYQFLIEIDAKTSSGTPETLYFCCASGASGFTGLGSDGNSHTWLPRIVDPGLIQKNLFSGDKISGPSTCTFGEVVLGNFKKLTESAGPIDALKNYRFYGSKIRMYFGLNNATSLSGFTQAYSAIVENPTVGWETISFAIRGPQADLDVPLYTTTFLGNNVLPDGLEGNIDLKDKLKPVVLGRVYNISPVLCNSYKLIYAVTPFTGLSAGELNSDLHVYDNGVELYCAGVVSDIEAAGFPPFGQFYASVAGYIRLGVAPAGVLTCNAAQQGYALIATPSNLVDYVLDNTSHSSMVDSNSYTGFAPTDGYERGLFLSGSTNISTIIDQLVAPIGYWFFTPLGKIVLGVLKDPSTMTSVYTFTKDVNILNFTRRKTSDTTGGVPANKITVSYNKNYTLESQPTWDLPVDRKTWLNTEVRSISVVPGAVQDLAEELIFDSACSRSNTLHTGTLETLHCVEREIIDIDWLWLSTTDFLTVSRIPLGSCVTVNLLGRFGYSSKKMLVVAMTINHVDESVKLSVWG